MIDSQAHYSMHVLRAQESILIGLVKFLVATLHVAPGEFIAAAVIVRV